MSEEDCCGECGDACPSLASPPESDGRVTIEVNFQDRDMLLNCFIAAHEADLTFNKWVAEALEAYIQTLPVLGDEGVSV